MSILLDLSFTIWLVWTQQDSLAIQNWSVSYNIWCLLQMVCIQVYGQDFRLHLRREGILKCRQTDCNLDTFPIFETSWIIRWQEGLHISTLDVIHSSTFREFWKGSIEKDVIWQFTWRTTSVRVRNILLWWGNIEFMELLRIDTNV